MDDRTDDIPADTPASPALAMLGDLAAQARERALRLVFGALEHLLRQQAWARDRLKAHPRKSIRIALDAAPVAGAAAPELLATIDEQGLLRAAQAGTRPDATLLLRPSAGALASLLREGPQGLSAHLRVEGDVMLAATLGELAQHLRWDAEEDLSRVLGDVAAHRLVGLAGEGFARFRDLARRVESAAAQFLGAPQGPLAAGLQLGALRAEAARLDQQVQALEARVARLGRGRRGGSAASVAAPGAPAPLPANPYAPPPSQRR
ncbi:MAG TPA: SCP2 sterol-binding domain-containing protein [Quisquiliibacterium sp.]|nr:SCP2 sterol-binding domain-containing protein [Quisquiliibacterium sp.]